jgi:hypothetical protein
MTDIDSGRSHEQALPPRGYRRYIGTGTGFGILGGICCIGSAIAVGAGIGGLSFFTTWMNRYQMYIVLGSVAIMTAWLIRRARRDGIRRGFAASIRLIWREAVIMGAAYGITLLIATAVSGLIRGS